MATPSILSPIRRQRSPTSGRINASGEAQIINAGGSSVNVDKQEFLKDAREVNVAGIESSNNQTTTTNNQGNTYNYNFRSPTTYKAPNRSWSNDTTASWMKNRSNVPGVDRYPWNEGQKAFRLPGENERQHEEYNNRWNAVLPVVASLNAATLKFDERCCGGSLRRKDSGIFTWSQAKSEVRREIRHAREYYKSGERKQSKMGDTIRRIKEDIDSLFLWLDWLPDDPFRYCICGFIKSTLAAIADGQDLHESILASIGTVIALFNDSEDYLQLCRERRLTSDMSNTTVEIFVETAALCTSLLNVGLLPPRKQKKTSQIRSQLEHLQRILKEINSSARSKRQRQGMPSRATDPIELKIVHLFSNVLGANPVLPQVDAMMQQSSSVTIPQKRMKEIHDSGERERSSERRKSSERGPSVSTLLDALSFRSKHNEEDIKACLDFAEISRKKRRKLSALTREEPFQDWLKEESHSSSLVMYGNLDDEDEISPITYLVARIGKQYYDKEGFIVLSYVCGIHGRLGAVALLARITGQLLSQAKPMLGKCTDLICRNELKYLKKQDMKVLLKLFEETVKQLRSSRVIIFCLIDSISTYENEDTEEDTGVMLKALSRLVRSMRGRRRDKARDKMVFKLLISDAMRSLRAHEYFKDDELLEMPDDDGDASEGELFGEDDDGDGEEDYDNDEDGENVSDGASESSVESYS